MISYYGSKYPGLLYYISLVASSTLYFTFAPLQNWSLGLLVMLWSVYVFMRALSMLEATNYQAPLKTSGRASNNTMLLPSSLPTDLMKRMNGRDNLKRADNAMNLALGGHTTFWLGLAALYGACEIYLGLHNISPSTSTLGLQQKIAILFMIGAAFWAGQSYTENATITKIMVALFTILLLTSTTFAFHGHIASLLTTVQNPEQIKIGLPVLIGMPLFFYSLTMILPAFVKGKAYALPALAALALLSLMALAALSLPHETPRVAFWIAAWSLFSILCARSIRQRRKVYRLTV